MTQLHKFKFLQVLTIQLFFILAILCLRHIEFKTYVILIFSIAHRYLYV